MYCLEEGRDMRRLSVLCGVKVGIRVTVPAAG
jgi:hypothetical protein